MHMVFWLFFHWNGDLSRLTVVLALPFHFLDIHGVVVFPFGFFWLVLIIPYDCGLEQMLWNPCNNLG